MDAIVGLAAAGKTAVFRALTSGHGSSASGSRGEHVGVVKLPDERLTKLASLAGARKVTQHEVTLHDLLAIVGLEFLLVDAPGPAQDHGRERVARSCRTAPTTAARGSARSFV